MLSAEDVGFKVVPPLLTCHLQGGWWVPGMASQILLQKPSVLHRPGDRSSCKNGELCSQVEKTAEAGSVGSVYWVCGLSSIVILSPFQLPPAGKHWCAWSVLDA